MLEKLDDQIWITELQVLFNSSEIRRIGKKFDYVPLFVLIYLA